MSRELCLDQQVICERDGRVTSQEGRHSGHKGSGRVRQATRLADLWRVEPTDRVKVGCGGDKIR